jgi:hypothetical protein
MRDRGPVVVTLTGYFFRRFFENDLIEASGDTLTTIVRALSISAAPGLMLAFFMQNAYPGRGAWGRVEDHYFFVLYSMLVMAGVAIFEWEMLFPDKLDFLVLSPLPLRERETLGAKACALGLFLGLFLFATNVFGALMLPAVSKEHFWRQVVAHCLAVTCSGAFGALAVLAAGGLLICVLPARAFRIISPMLQMLVVAVLGLLLVSYVRFGDSLDKTLQIPLGHASWVPSFWFLGLYECTMRGSAAAEFATPMMWRGIWAISIAFAVAAATYPLAWARMRRMAIEGNAGMQGRPAMSLNRLVAAVVPLAACRAVTYFIGQTIARNSKYQVYLAMYCGTGLALAVACAVTFVSSGDGLRPMASTAGLHAVMPLVLFWIIAGLRMAFGLPLNLPARWVFRVTGAEREACISATRVWALVCGLAALGLLLPILWAAGIGARGLLVQGVCGVSLCVVLVDGLLFANHGIPFAHPRSPGKTSLPLMLTLFVGILPLFCLSMVRAELWLERTPLWLSATVVVVPIAHVAIGLLRKRSQARLEDGDEIEGEFQLLGLGVD